ncbi:Eukaryotic translation initiation factor 4B [Tieghemiomyces parasiticus]|uniref:Eukaryotic translation initiation factor 4B n=1 Tax=Tieghemiomyces parasiticus TaxID=78921 RepID=A0A9W8E2J0_9FUNG|nr:Eukaryotic translation initiation factor 4B [Tieghemiomyces parasiticus]
MTKQSKKKGQSMSLSDFLKDDKTGSWADETTELPSAPAASFAGGSAASGRGFGQGFQRSSYGARGPAAPVDLSELPKDPPFTAYVGNLPFGVTEEILAEFFAPGKIAGIRLIRDRMTDRPKGYGYVEFSDVESLAQALGLSGEGLQGRPIRINLAEPPKEGFGTAMRSNRGFEDEDRLSGVSNWRRETPLPAAENPAMAASSDWRATAGAAPAGPPRGFNASRDGPTPRDGEAPRPPRFQPQPSISDDAGNWRENRQTPQPLPTATGRPGLHGSDSYSSPPTTASAGLPPVSTVPLVRKKLQLTPRTTPVATGSETNAPAVAVTSPHRKPNPFGEAKPRDELEMQRRVEERRRERSSSTASKPGTTTNVDASSATSTPARVTSPAPAAKPTEA